MLPLRGDGPADSQPCLPRGAGLEEKQHSHGPQSQSMCWARGHSWASSQGTTPQCCSLGHETVLTQTCERCLQNSEGDFGLDVRHF